MRICLLIIILGFGTTSNAQFDDKLTLNIEVQTPEISSLKELKVSISLKNSSDHNTHFYSNLVDDPSVLFYLIDSVQQKISLSYRSTPKPLDQIITIETHQSIERTYDFEDCTTEINPGKYKLVSGFFNNTPVYFSVK